jgi:hypothetical protein
MVSPDYHFWLFSEKLLTGFRFASTRSTRTHERDKKGRWVRKKSNIDSRTLFITSCTCILLSWLRWLFIPLLVLFSEKLLTGFRLASTHKHADGFEKGDHCIQTQEKANWIVGVCVHNLEGRAFRLGPSGNRSDLTFCPLPRSAAYCMPF